MRVRVLSAAEKEARAAYARAYRAARRHDKTWMAKEAARRMVS